MAKVFFDKVTIFGVGLLGASFALALKKRNMARHITGCGRNKDNLKKAVDRRIIDAMELDPAKACKDSDLILFSMPVGAFTNVAKQITGSLKKNAVVTDVGSVKGKLVSEMETLMPEGVSFVGCHPIAGNHKSGIDAATPDLFAGAQCIITKTDKTDKKAFDAVYELWNELEAEIKFSSPEEHDMIYAAVSHFPHVVAYSLVNTVADIDSSYMNFSGQGFKDSTRIALSSPELWRDICIMNKDNIIKLIDIFQKNLEMVRSSLEKSDSNEIEKEFKKAQSLRKNVR